MIIKANIPALCEQCEQWARANRGITRVYLFGSRVYGSPRPDSDLDIFVVGDAAGYDLHHETWQWDWTARLGVRCDVHNYSNASDCVKSEAMGHGLRVFSLHGDERDFDLGEDAPDEIDVSDPPDPLLAEQVDPNFTAHDN